MSVLVFIAKALIASALLIPAQGTSTNGPPELSQLLKLQDWPAAERLCRKSLAQDPSSADAAFLLAYTLFRQGKAADSLAAYTAAARLRRPTSGDLMAVASDYVLLSDYSDADRWFTKVTALEPSNALAWYDRGRTEYKLEQFVSARAAFERVLTLEPDNTRAVDNLGLTLHMLGDETGARGAFTHAVTLETAHPSGYPLPYLNLGMLLVRADDLPDAMPYLQKAVALAPGNPTAREQLGRAYAQSGHESDAIRELEAATRLAPESGPLHYLLGRLYAKQGRKEDAAAQFRRTAELNAKQVPSEVPNTLAPESPR